jgi:signal transduction histidine kinase
VIGTYIAEAAGAGLGLVVVAEIARDHGGAVYVRTLPGLGVSVEGLLPIEPRGRP